MKTTDKRHIILWELLFLLLLIGATAKAQLPSPSYPPRLVNDYAGVLSTNEVNTLERMLVNYNDTTSTQFLVLLVDDLQGYNIDQYATEIGHSWGVGQRGKNNGAVIVVKPARNNEKGRVAISTGYGLEEYITDATAKRIIEKEMYPAFREGDYYTGILNAITVMMDLCSGKFTQDEYSKDDGIPVWMIILFIIGIILILRGFNNNQNYTSGGSRTIWIPMGGGGFGGGFGGGHSSGGFGGFGGGGFGGGGASGSW